MAMAQRKLDPAPIDAHEVAVRTAIRLFAAADRARWASQECARGAAAAALVSIASVLANAAGWLAAALILAGAFLVRRLAWRARARSERAAAHSAEMTASFAASNWRRRTQLHPRFRVVL